MNAEKRERRYRPGGRINGVRDNVPSRPLRVQVRPWLPGEHGHRAHLALRPRDGVIRAACVDCGAVFSEAIYRTTRSAKHADPYDLTPLTAKGAL